MQTRDDLVASRVARLLSNGAGGLDWAGLDVAVELYGVDDVEMLIERLLVIRDYEAPKV